MFEWLFLNLHSLALWLPAFGLAALLRIITHKYHHQLIFPACESFAKRDIMYQTLEDFILIPILFYLVVAIGGFNLGELREAGWLFTTGGSNDPWYKFYTLFGLFFGLVSPSTPLNARIDFRAIQWGPFWRALPTQLALCVQAISLATPSFTIL